MWIDVCNSDLFHAFRKKALGLSAKKRLGCELQNQPLPTAPCLTFYAMPVVLQISGGRPDFGRV
jgi:hypothetical protein